LRKPPDGARAFETRSEMVMVRAVTKVRVIVRIIFDNSSLWTERLIGEAGLTPVSVAKKGIRVEFGTPPGDRGKPQRRNCICNVIKCPDDLMPER